MTAQAILQREISIPNTRNMLNFGTMNLQDEKNELAKLILETEDVVLLQRIKEFIHHYQSNFWHSLPQHVKDGVQVSLKQTDDGLVSPWEEVKKRMKDL